MRLVMLVVALLCLGAGTCELRAAPQDAAQEAGDAHAGLQTGEKAPAFAANDQFGHEQNNDSLHGDHGTVLLFFRSADW